MFEDCGLPEPRVGFAVDPRRSDRGECCGDESGPWATALPRICPGEDTIYISQKFAANMYDGSLDQVLPGSSQAYGRTIGDFAVRVHRCARPATRFRTSSASSRNSGQLPTIAFELPATATRARRRTAPTDENRLEDGDVQEALDAALAVGDFDASNPSHHGTPEQREEAWNIGFDGRPLLVQRVPGPRQVSATAPSSPLAEHGLERDADQLEAASQAVERELADLVLRNAEQLARAVASPGGLSESATAGSRSRSVSRTVSACSGCSRTVSRRNQTP